MKLSLDRIEIDQEALQDTQQRCQRRAVSSNVVWSKHTRSLLFQLLLMECKGFVLLLLGFVALLWLLAPWFAEAYDLFILFQTGMSVVFALVYLLKDVHTKQQEVFFPTRVGGTRIFLYKTAIFTIVSLLCTMLLIAKGLYFYGYSLYHLLFVSVIPQLLLHGLAMQIAGRCYSLKAALAVLLVLYASYLLGYLLLLTMPGVLLQLLPYAGILMIACGIYDSYAVCFFHQKINKEGGYILWN